MKTAPRACDLECAYPQPVSGSVFKFHAFSVGGGPSGAEYSSKLEAIRRVFFFWGGGGWCYIVSAPVTVMFVNGLVRYHGS